MRKYLAPFFLVIIAFIFNFLAVFSQKYCTDFQIIFEGGYRIGLGQMPYRDFFLPLGPIVFYLQHIFNQFLGVNIWSMALHSSSLTAVLVVVYYFFARPIVGLIGACFFSIMML